jgi:hypothetical protein
MVILLVAVTAVATVVIACAGPGHVLMTAGSAGDGLCSFVGHSGIGPAGEGIDSAAAGSLLTLFSGVALALGAALLFALRDTLATLVPVHVPDDPRHGRLLI